MFLDCNKSDLELLEQTNGAHDNEERYLEGVYVAAAAADDFDSR